MCVYMCLQDVQPGGLRASGRQSRSPRSVSVHIQVRLCVSAVLTAFCVCVLQLLAEYGGFGCLFWCSDTVGWVTERACVHLVPAISKPKG